MGIATPPFPRAPKTEKPKEMFEWAKAISKFLDSFSTQLKNAINIPVSSSVPTETPEFPPMMKLYDSGAGVYRLYVYVNGSWRRTSLNVTDFGESLTDDANASAALTTLGVTSFAKTILDDTTAAAVRATIGADPSPAAFSGLVIKPTSNSVVNLAADSLLLTDSSDMTRRIKSVNLDDIDITRNGANGLDTGSVAANTWYSVWGIHNGSTKAGLLSVNETSPNLPSGYTFSARFGWVKTAPASTNLCRTIQYGRRAQWIVDGTVLTGMPLMGSGSAGNVTTPTWVSIAWAPFAPSTAGALLFLARAYNGNYVIVAPNNNYGGVNDATNPPFFLVHAPSSNNNGGRGSVMLESTNIFWASSGGDSRCSLFCSGWEDKL
jgi:hypothetical protein